MDIKIKQYVDELYIEDYEDIPETHIVIGNMIHLKNKFGIIIH